MRPARPLPPPPRRHRCRCHPLSSCVARCLQAQALTGVDGVVTKNLFLKVAARLLTCPWDCFQSCHPVALHAAARPRCSLRDRLGWGLTLPALLPATLQDKKGRLYIITAAADTKVDLKRALGYDGACRPPNAAAVLPFSCIARPLMLSEVPSLPAVLSLRLGCGKGGLRMAPDDLLTAVLQVRSHDAFCFTSIMLP